MKSWFSTMAKISIIVFTFAVYLSSAPSASAGADDNVFGSAWSDNIGWISFNSCTNPTPNFVGTSCGPYDYGVKLDKTTLEVSGTAWNDNVGWISFNPSDWGGKCSPSGASCTGFKNKWQAGGWARVISGKAYDKNANQNLTNSGNFDGWISLGGTTYEAPFDMTTNISASMPADYADNTIYRIDSSPNGYWWGSEVVGWIDLNPTSSLDPFEGGVFLIDLSTDTLELTSNATDDTVVAGDNVDIHWKTNGFIPTECTGTMFDSKGKPILNADWNKTFNYTGVTEEDITDIEVPGDYPNNANKIATKYTLLCKNSVKKAAQTITIIAEPLTVFLKSAQSCFSGTTSILDWYTNDTSQSCSIEAVTAPGGYGTYNVSVTGESPGRADDTDFEANLGNGPTKYSLTCENGTSRTYQNAITAKTTGTVSVNQCTADYSVSYSPSCQPFNSNPTNYDATVELSVVNPLYGFNSDVTVSDGGGLGIWTFAPGDTISSPYASTINATLTLTKAEYNSIDWKTKFFRDLFFDATGVSTKTKSIELCESGTRKVKPKYVPF